MGNSGGKHAGGAEQAEANSALATRTSAEAMAKTEAAIAAAINEAATVNTSAAMMYLEGSCIRSPSPVLGSKDMPCEEQDPLFWRTTKGATSRAQKATRPTSPASSASTSPGLRAEDAAWEESESVLSLQKGASAAARFRQGLRRSFEHLLDASSRERRLILTNEASPDGRRALRLGECCVMPSPLPSRSGRGSFVPVPPEAQAVTRAPRS